MPETTLWMIRHGETAWNLERRFQGQIDIPLNCTGREQAEFLACRLRDDHESRPFAAIYTSDLTRARETAAPIAARLGIAPTIDTSMRERHFGVLGALTPEEMAQSQPHEFAQWKARNPDHVIEGGESLRNLYQRVVQGMTRIATQHPGAQVIVVTHGGVLDVAYRAAKAMDLSLPRKHDLLNASINRIRYRAGAFSLESWGDVSHLDVEAFDEA
ncbi:MAG: histidine phosphatase family protein [Burkholderiales bacterium]|nr:histidine phosphatase family protein [Burkholderiales bacterium]